MLVDPPNGAPVVIYDPCPTGNAAGGGYQLAGTYFSSHNYVQEWAAFGGAADWGTRLVVRGGGYRSSDAGVWTQLSFRGPGTTASCDPASDTNAGCDTSVGGAREGGSGPSGGLGGIETRFLRGRGIVGGSGVPSYTIGNKISGQMPKRGWTTPAVEDAHTNSTRTVPTTDLRTGDPATGYYVLQEAL